MKPCPDTFPFPLVALDETASTNQYLSQLCNQLQESVAELTTVTAEFQTAGKGQRGNTWEAEEGKNLLFSFVLYPTFLEARRQFILSQIVSLSIKEELDVPVKYIGVGEQIDDLQPFDAQDFAKALFDHEKDSY